MAMPEIERNTTTLTETLVLSRTRAADLESVRKLNCWASNISDASIVRKMPNLEVCSLSVNNLTSLEDFSHCPCLQELYIRKNCIQHLTDVHYLKNLERLRVLWLADNPCSQGDNYRMTVLKTLPNLQKLDNIAVSEEELHFAMEQGDDLPLPSKFQTNDNSCDTNGLHNSNNNSTEETSTREDEKETLENATVIESREEHLKPERSDCMPSFGANFMEKQRQKLQQDTLKISWEETNQIRAQLGLKPLPVSKLMQSKPAITGTTKVQNANVLQAVLLLIQELDKDSLEAVANEIHNRLETM